MLLHFILSFVTHDVDLSENFYQSIQVQVLNLSTSTLQIIYLEKKVTFYILIINLYYDYTFRISILFVVCIRSEQVYYISG